MKTSAKDIEKLLHAVAQSDLGWHNGTLCENIKRAKSLYTQKIEGATLKIVNDDCYFVVSLFKDNELKAASDVDKTIKAINNEIEHFNRCYKVNFELLAA